MSEEELQYRLAVSNTLEHLSAQVNALEQVAFAAVRELEEKMPGFRHACLERVSAQLAVMPPASGKGLEVRQRTMEFAEDILRS